jgi:hypothetical protein
VTVNYTNGSEHKRCHRPGRAHTPTEPPVVKMLSEPILTVSDGRWNYAVSLESVSMPRLPCVWCRQATARPRAILFRVLLAGGPTTGARFKQKLPQPALPHSVAHFLERKVRNQDQQHNKT